SCTDASTFPFLVYVLLLFASYCFATSEETTIKEAPIVERVLRSHKEKGRILEEEELETLLNSISSNTKELRKLEYRIREMERKLIVKEDEVEEMKAILAAKDGQINRLMEVYDEQTRDDGKSSLTKKEKDNANLIIIISVVGSFIYKLLRDCKERKQQKAEAEAAITVEMENLIDKIKSEEVDSAATYSHSFRVVALPLGCKFCYLSIFVSRIIENCGGLRVGDQIFAINDTDVRGLNYQALVEIINNSAQPTLLLVRHNPEWITVMLTMLEQKIENIGSKRAISNERDSIDLI
ncbi:hypothetical protein PMAYCL1PPCAC_11655, partial [Pristionchus mayeri]